ncbi:MAG: hypothetical protein JNL98_31510 [Bryobacterales bacterium]|nr:hypothetical protein [Bryobacterales bacterium]
MATAVSVDAALMEEAGATAQHTQPARGRSIPPARHCLRTLLGIWTSGPLNQACSSLSGDGAWPETDRPGSAVGRATALNGSRVVTVDTEQAVVT